MKASDTLMSDEQLDDIGYPLLPIGDRTGYRRVAEAQAEITFKSVMKAIVEWADGECPHTSAYHSLPRRLCFICWQDWLKE